VTLRAVMMPALAASSEQVPTNNREVFRKKWFFFRRVKRLITVFSRREEPRYLVQI
jgi:hypothetical protein